jgi:hypothetical protein
MARSSCLSMKGCSDLSKTAMNPCAVGAHSVLVGVSPIAAGRSRRPAAPRGWRTRRCSSCRPAPCGKRLANRADSPRRGPGLSHSASPGTVARAAAKAQYTRWGEQAASHCGEWAWIDLMRAQEDASCADAQTGTRLPARDDLAYSFPTMKQENDRIFGGARAPVILRRRRDTVCGWKR